jgi:predicted DNA-binding transcriptional regulator AlpA
MPPRQQQPFSQPVHPDRIVGEREAAQLRGVSKDTLRRIALNTGKPRRIRLSPRRVGYKLSEVLDL